MNFKVRIGQCKRKGNFHVFSDFANEEVMPGADARFPICLKIYFPHC